MASVLIDSGPVTATLPLREVPREKWRDLMLARRSFLAIKLSHDCRCLVEFVNDAETMHSELNYATAEDMIRDGYGLEPPEIAIAVRWLQLNPPPEPIALKTAIKLGKREIGIEGGKPGPGRGKKTACNTSRFPSYGTVEYWLPRFDRDRPDLAARVRAGELTANAAAEEAGWRKRMTALERIQKLWATLNAAERKAHLDWTLKHCATCGRSGAEDGEWCDACCDEGIADAEELPPLGSQY
jgi:hypothetical protein